jgi:hypothetical protein
MMGHLFLKERRETMLASRLFYYERRLFVSGWKFYSC